MILRGNWESVRHESHWMLSCFVLLREVVVVVVVVDCLRVSVTVFVVSEETMVVAMDWECTTVALVPIEASW